MQWHDFLLLIARKRKNETLCRYMEHSLLNLLPERDK